MIVDLQIDVLLLLIMFFLTLLCKGFSIKRVFTNFLLISFSIVLWVAKVGITGYILGFNSQWTF